MGNRYYISENGNDANNGLSPEAAWRTFQNVDANTQIVKEGDQVLFERGGIYRGSLLTVSGVTYGAYGEGEKPCLYGSLRNYALPELWEADSREHIWKLHVGDMRDIGNVVFDHDYLDKWAMKRLSLELKENFDYYHDREQGILYLYLDKGNPGEVYQDIEVCSDEHILWGKHFMHDILIEDLCLKYTGAHGICFWHGSKNITVRNCEIGCIGGSMLEGFPVPVRYGNGFEVVDGCEDILVEDNYVYHCYDAGITHQSSNPAGCVQKKITFRRNRIEYCHYSIEYYVDCENGMIEDTVYEDNILRYAGYGFGSVNRIGSNTSVLSHICCYARNIPCKNFIIRNNIFDRSLRKILAIGTPNDKNGLGPVITGNTYILEKKAETEVAMVRDEANQEMTLMGDTQEALKDAVALLDEKPKEVRLEGFFQAKWICSTKKVQDVCPVFRKQVIVDKKIKSACFKITALGVYEVQINHKRVSDYVLAPGWTVYDKRIQYQAYDISDMLTNENEIEIYLGKGWYASPIPGWMDTPDKLRRTSRHTGMIAELHIVYEDESYDVISTDYNWQWSESEIRFSEIYDGETYDAEIERQWNPAVEFDGPDECLIPQEGEIVREIECLEAKRMFQTPKGELVVDFGQEVTGYVEFEINAKGGEELIIYHGEVLDKEGNFYNANYRGAKAQIQYRCKAGKQVYHPHLTFFGFRYIKLEGFPNDITPEQFKAIVVCSDIKRTGYLHCGVEDLNKLFSNIVWSQKGNFLDVPTDCPQRDERLGWTGDVLVFVKAASYFYDVEKFFKKWLGDLKADQNEDGSVGQVIPDYLTGVTKPSAGWGDVATVCPWQIYLTYGDASVLEEQFDSMKQWVDYITNTTTQKGLWIGGEHFGDWLGLDAEAGSFKGASRDDFIASAFYAYSTELLIKAGKILKMDMSAYEDLYALIVKTFREEYPEYLTQTEHVLAIKFGLASDCQKSADALAEMVRRDGIQLKTGFIGTPYLLHALSDYGHEELAYDLLLRKSYPSWLYPISKGATTIWEHWDGQMENGDFWCDEMNSFNHYAYGAVADWVFEKALGIQVMESYPGFEKVRIEPKADARLGWLEGSVQTRHGKVSVKWSVSEGETRYEIQNDMPAEIVIGGKTYQKEKGNYIFWN